MEGLQPRSSLSAWDKGVFFTQGGFWVVILCCCVHQVTVLLQACARPFAHTLSGVPQAFEAPLLPSPLCRWKQEGSAKRSELPKIIKEEEAELGFEPRSAGTPGDLQVLSKGLAS